MWNGIQWLWSQIKAQTDYLGWLSSLCHGGCSVGCMSCTPGWELSFHWADATCPTTKYQERLAAYGRSLPCHQEGLVRSFWQQPTARLVLAGLEAAFCQPYVPASTWEMWPNGSLSVWVVSKVCWGCWRVFTWCSIKCLHQIPELFFAFYKDSTGYEKCKTTSVTSV